MYYVLHCLFFSVCNSLLIIKKKLTFIRSFNSLTRAAQTCGTIKDIVESDTLNKYINDLYESPLARNLNVINNLTEAGILLR
jgi:uncharacterized protein (DUF488 family)